MDAFIEATKDGIVETHVVDGVLVVNFRRGRIREEREVLKSLSELGRVIDSSSRSRILIDMENIEYLSSAGLGTLVGLLKKSRKVSGTLKLCRLQPSIFELFEVMRLTKIFEIFDDYEEAVKSFD